MNITFVTASYPRFPGGGSKVVYEHANRLAARGHDVRVVHSLALPPGLVPAVAGWSRHKLRDYRSGQLHREIRWVTAHPSVEVVVLRRLDDLGGLEPTDVMVATFWLTTRAIRSAAPGTPCLQLMQAYETWAAPPEQIEKVWRLPLHKAVVSTALIRQGEALGVPTELLHYVPNGIDLDVFRPSTPFQERAPHLAFLAHESPVKGLETAVRVAGLVHAAYPDVPVTAFGGSRRPAALPPWIHYVEGHTGGALVESVYDLCSVFLCTSLSEGWGYPSLEAMACGTALVSTRNGGVDDFATDGESALLADVDDVEALFEATLRLLTDPALRVPMSERGMARAQEFGWDRSSAAFENALRTAAAAGPS